FLPGSLYTITPSRPSPRNGPSFHDGGRLRHRRSWPRRKADHCASVAIWLSSGMGVAAKAGTGSADTAVAASGNAAAAPSRDRRLTTAHLRIIGSIYVSVRLTRQA